MLKQYGFDARWKRIHADLRPYLPSRPVLGACALLALGAGLFFILPDSEETARADAPAAAAPVAASADESLCDKQTWPYIDQRCAARVEAARGARKVRIVTDKGHSVNTVTPMPVVEQKPAPQPPPQPKPTVATAAPRIGPAVIPAPENPPAEQQNASAAKPSEPQTTGSAPPGSKAMASAVPPEAASKEAPSSGVDAIDDSRPKSRSERAEKRAQDKAKREAQKREAKRMRQIERDTGSVPQEVVDSVKAVAGDQRGAERPRSRRVRDGAPEETVGSAKAAATDKGAAERPRGKNARKSGVPDDVIQAVEAAAARERGRAVTVESPTERRVYVVPGDGMQ